MCAYVWNKLYGNNETDKRNAISGFILYYNLVDDKVNELQDSLIENV